MASIQRIVSPITASISYRAQVRVKGRPARSETFSSRKDAKEWADSVESAIRENRHFPSRQAMRTTLAEAVARYQQSVLKDLRPSTRRARTQHLEWWVGHFGGLTLAEVTPDRIAEARDELANGTYRRGKASVDKDGKEAPPKEYRRSGATTNRYVAWS